MLTRASLVLATLALAAGCGSSDKTCPDGSPPAAAEAGPDQGQPREASVKPDGPAPATPRTTQLKTFDEILAAYQAGRPLRAIFKYGQCSLAGAKGPNAVGGVYALAAERLSKGGAVANGQIVFSDSKLILDPLSAGTDKNAHVYNNATIRILESGAVQVISQYLMVPGSTVTMSEVFECSLEAGKGAAVHVENPAGAPAQPEQLKGLDAVMTALQAGEPVTAVADLSRCTLGAGSDASPASDPSLVNLAMGTFEWFAAGLLYPGSKARLSASEAILALDPADAGQTGYVFMYTKLALSSDGAVQVVRQQIDPTTFAAKLNQTYACKLDDGSGSGAVRYLRR